MGQLCRCRNQPVNQGRDKFALKLYLAGIRGLFDLLDRNLEQSTPPFRGYSRSTLAFGKEGDLAEDFSPG